MPISHPNKQRANHLANLKNGENDSSTGEVVLANIVIGLIRLQRIDRAHQRPIVALQLMR